MKKMVTILALILAQNSYALELEGANGVNILAINGKKVESGIFSANDINVEPGEHQVVVRYSAHFNNDHLIESRPTIFTIDLQQDSKISVPKMYTQQQADRAINNGLTWQVVTEDNTYVIEKADTLVGKGFMPYRDIEGLINTYNQENNITTAVTATTAAATAAVATTKTTAAVATAEVATKTVLSISLIEQYQQASREDKKAFRLWLLEQDMK